MAVTSGGTPYVESSDLVANYPSTSLSLANKVDTKLDNALTANTQSGTTYTFVLADARQLVTATNAGAKTFTIPPQSSVTWLANSTIRVVNYGAGALTIAGGVGVTVTNAAKTLAQYESAALIRTGSDAWTLVPFSGGAANADFSNTATGTYTGGDGKSYKYVSFTGSGTLTVTKAGYADILIVGSGAGAGTTGGFVGGCGGGGGVSYQTVPLTATTYSVVVGGGGAGGSIGNISYVRAGTSPLTDPFRLLVPGGSQGGSSGSAGGSGQATGGGGSNNSGGTAGFSNTYGGNGTTYASGGAGGTATANTAGGIGAGIASSITGSSINYGEGNFTGGAAPAANTGKGGIPSNGAGASGVVIVRVQV